MTFLTSKQVLDKLQTRIKDQSTTLRTKATSWLCSLMHDAVAERQWWFLEKSALALPITANAITLPTDFSVETGIVASDLTFTPENDRYSAMDLLKNPSGYTLGLSTITFGADITGTADLYYIATMPATGYGDTNDPTIFPFEFMPLFERSLLTAFEEYDVDLDRLPVSLQLDQKELRLMKRLDDSRKPQPKTSSHGYVRTR